MAKIVFYEANKIDIFQITNALQNSDHTITFDDDVITTDTAVTDAEVISVFVDSDVSRSVLERMPNLKLIATRSTGYDHIDLDAAQELGIAVVNVPAYGDATVAEHVFALLLMLSRKMLDTLEATEHGTFDSSQHVGTDLQGRTLGILGAGRIGQHTAQIAKGFGMEVIAYDKYPSQEAADRIGYTYASFDDVIARSDIVSLHTPLTAEDFHIINEGTIERMKQGVILINTARGELIENRALIRALKSGHVAGAGLDTVEGELFLNHRNVLDTINDNAASPDDYAHIAEVQALSALPNVVITPHSAFNTAEAIERINTTTVDNIAHFFEGDVQNKITGSNKTGKLVVVRHGQSEWNLLGKWTGTTDVHLTQEGIEKSAELGKKLADITFDYAYISQQIRTKETIEAVMNGSGQLDLRYEPTLAMNERDYGIYTGMNKEQIREIVGEAAFNELRRSWDGPVEGGESLKDVYQRVIPFYLRIILPRLRHGQNILLVAHGNSIRSLVKYLENISDADIGSVEMIQKSALIYEVDSNGRSKNKQQVVID